MTDSLGLSGFSTPVLVTAFDVPVISLDIKGDATVAAGGSPAKVLVSRTGDISTALTVSYKVKGNAQAGVDYKKLSGTVTIAAGASTAKIKVKAIDGSPNVGVLKIKFALLPATDGSYTVGTATAKIKLVDE